MAFDDMAWGIDEITENVKTGIIPIVKNIQMGTYTFTNEQNATITITSANPGKYIVLLNSGLTFFYTGEGSYSNDDYVVASNLISKAETSFVISSNFGYIYKRRDLDSEPTMEYKFGTVTWQLIEFY